MLGADVVKNEITSQAVAAMHFYPDVRTIFEIGGQDSKIILINNGMIVDFAMNTVCAAGTGSFLDHQSERMGIPIERFGELALTAKNNVRISGRCTVFAESDMISKQQFGHTPAEIINGLCEALVRNYLNNLGRGKKLEPPFLFQGGVANNKGIIAAFEKELGEKITVPEHHNVMGAIGVGILTKEYMEKERINTQFRGFSVGNVDFKPRSFACSDCAKACEVVKIEIDDEVVAYLNDKCSKYTNSILSSNKNKNKELKLVS